MDPKPMVFYPNSIKLYFREDIHVHRNDILDALKIEVIELGENMRDVIRIGQMGNQFKWYVQFKNDDWYKQLFGKKIQIKNQEVYIDDANDNCVIKTFRVLQLPPCVELSFLEYNFKKFGDIHEITEETVRDGEYEGLGTGIYRVKMRFSKEQAKHLNEIHGVKKYQSERFIIQMVGHQNCFLCSKSDHQKKDCPNVNLKCVKCKGRGHEFKDCNDAKRLFHQNFDENLLALNDEDNEQHSSKIIAPVTSSERPGSTEPTSKETKCIESNRKRPSTKRLDRSNNSDNLDPDPKKDRLDDTNDSNQQSDLEDNDYQKT